MASGSPTWLVVEASWVGSGSYARWPGFHPFGRLRDPGPAVVGLPTSSAHFQNEDGVQECKSVRAQECKGVSV